ncbi:hypothetical protein SELR_13190 [Selenomonas ruminantium subsp. lactilytica TAM6421]|uniref:Uncharacterized protein n=1 Tax=Selenomonas ruminantium subsp. lactilytica (strain NBRC 103574 / TAM6421) TaxID=927704 RepID=I0GQJ0_SELRL|nr:hypothetical protein [Selenomonas ruminantium]BAL83027.1 hypothetical protein SELR_13190 [Selenomonas ruminantium subsp. lactilytica TAM6421]
MLEDYQHDYSKVYSWLSWGGLILPEVVRNKDGSLMGFIRYGQPAETTADEISLDYPKGWGMWLDRHHFAGDNTETLCLLWNPIRRGSNFPAVNLCEGIWRGSEAEEDYFRKVLMELSRKVPGGLVLQREQILSYLQSTLEMQFCEVTMPEIPLYLDAVLSKDMEFKVYDPHGRDRNRFTIRGKDIAVTSIKVSLQESKLDMVLKAFRQMDYRFCRRCLFMPEDNLRQELRKMTAKWCPKRQSVRDYMLSKQAGSGGMISDTLVFALDSGVAEEYHRYIREILEAVEVPFVVEDYNSKQCWWGTLPGMFRANGKILPRREKNWQDFLGLKGVEKASV